MKSLIVVALMGLSYWLGIASQPQQRPVEFYRAPTAPPKAALTEQCDEERERICKARKRLEKIRKG